MPERVGEPPVRGPERPGAGPVPGTSLDRSPVGRGTDVVAAIVRERARAGAWVLFAAALVLAVLQGGYAGSRWYPVAALAAIAAAVAWWPGRRPAPPLPTAVRVALAAAAGLCAWSALSILWADVPAAALEGANRTILYGLVLAVVVRAPWPAPVARTTLTAVAVVGALIATTMLLVLALDATPERLLLDGRLSSPLGYPNATAALWELLLWPLLVLAVDARRRPAARVAALAGAGLLLQTALLSQSRGGLAALVVVALLAIVLAERRSVTVAALTALAAATAASASLVVAVRGAPAGEPLRGAVDDAVVAIAGTTLLLAVATALAIAVAQRWEADTGPARRVAVALDRVRPSRTTAVVAGLIAVVLLGGVVAATADPVGAARERWQQLRSDDYRSVSGTGNRLGGSLGSNRPDMYRVAWGAFRDRPLTGVGADDFHATYLRSRRSDEAPRYAHSLPFGVLAGLGGVGVALWLALLGGLLAAWRGAWRRGGSATRAVVAAAVLLAASWFVHGLVDWLWEFPALTILAVAAAGIAARTVEAAAPVDGPAPAGGPDPDGGPAAGTRRRAGVGIVAARAGLVVAVVAATAIFGALGGAAALQRGGEAASRTDPERAIRDLGRAARLNPLDGDPLVSRAIVARRLGDQEAWEHDLRRAVSRSPHDWFARFELGLALAVRGDRAGAVGELRAARNLNPRQPLTGQVERAVRDGDAVTPAAVAAVERRLARDLSDKLRGPGA